MATVRKCAVKITVGCRNQPEKIGRYGISFERLIRKVEALCQCRSQLLGRHDAVPDQGFAKPPFVRPRSRLHLLHARVTTRNQNLVQMLTKERVRHRMTSARLKMGRYITIMMPPIMSPISSTSAGSTSVMIRASRFS